MEFFLHRRDFLKSCSTMGLGCAFLLSGTKLRAQESTVQAEEKKIVDPQKLTYCGYHCGMHCELYKATQENNLELKKKVFQDWNFKGKYGVEFDPNLVFCYGCKAGDKPKNLILEKCAVRECAIEKKIDTCVQCKMLKECKKELWSEFPEHKKNVLKLQESYVQQKGNKLI